MSSTNAGVSMSDVQAVEVMADGGQLLDAEPDLLAEAGAELKVDGDPAEGDEAVEQLSEGDLEEPPEDEFEEEDSDEEDEEEAEDEEEPEPEPKQKGSRAQKRIRQQVAQIKELKEAQTRQEQVMAQQMRQQQVQMQRAFQQQMAQQQQQNQLLQRQLDMLVSRRDQEDESKLPYVERFKREIQRETLAQARQQFDDELAQIRRQLAQEQTARQQMLAQQQSQARLVHFEQEVAKVRREALLAEMDDLQAAHGSTVDDMLLAYIAATNAQPAEAAQKFKQFLDGYHAAKMKSISKKSGKRTRTSKTIPSGAPSQKRTAKGNPRPSWEALQEAGFNDYVEWFEAGRPPVRER